MDIHNIPMAASLLLVYYSNKIISIFSVILMLLTISLQSLDGADALLAITVNNQQQQWVRTKLYYYL